MHGKDIYLFVKGKIKKMQHSIRGAIKAIMPGLALVLNVITDLEKLFGNQAPWMK